MRYPEGNFPSYLGLVQAFAERNGRTVGHLANSPGLNDLSRDANVYLKNRIDYERVQMQVSDIVENWQDTLSAEYDTRPQIQSAREGIGKAIQSAVHKLHPNVKGNELPKVVFEYQQKILEEIKANRRFPLRSERILSLFTSEDGNSEGQDVCNFFLAPHLNGYASERVLADLIQVDLELGRRFGTLESKHCENPPEKLNHIGTPEFEFWDAFTSLNTVGNLGGITQKMYLADMWLSVLPEHRGYQRQVKQFIDMWLPRFQEKEREYGRQVSVIDKRLEQEIALCIHTQPESDRTKFMIPGWFIMDVPTKDWKMTRRLYRADEVVVQDYLTW